MYTQTKRLYSFLTLHCSSRDLSRIELTIEEAGWIPLSFSLVLRKIQNRIIQVLMQSIKQKVQLTFKHA